MDTEGIAVSELYERLGKLLKTYPQVADYRIIVAAESGFSGTYLSKYIADEKFIGINTERQEIKLLTDDDCMDRYCEYFMF